MHSQTHHSVRTKPALSKHHVTRYQEKKEEGISQRKSAFCSICAASLAPLGTTGSFVHEPTHALLLRRSSTNALNFLPPTSSHSMNSTTPNFACHVARLACSGQSYLQMHRAGTWLTAASTCVPYPVFVSTKSHDANRSIYCMKGLRTDWGTKSCRRSVIPNDCERMPSGNIHLTSLIAGQSSRGNPSIPYPPTPMSTYRVAASPLVTSPNNLRFGSPLNDSGATFLPLASAGMSIEGVGCRKSSAFWYARSISSKMSKAPSNSSQYERKTSAQFKEHKATLGTPTRSAASNPKYGTLLKTRSGVNASS
mmetsp:Transcript_48520/g.146359  ORF Transcript_48520/g.146359 Transcript_48520/m.146359 type:complete len:309 (+) Transcript_48520:307-1233(+)